MCIWNWYVVYLGMFINLVFGGLQCHITNPQIPDKHSQINYSVFWGVYLVVVGGNYVFGFLYLMSGILYILYVSIILLVLILYLRCVLGI